MTYHPLAETYDTGEAYFTSLGLLGASTGMKPILSLPTALTTPDAYTSGLTVAVNDSVVTQTTSTDDWISWNLLDSGSTSYSKLLVIGYGMADYFSVGASENAYTGATAGNYLKDFYQWLSNLGNLYSNNGTTTSNFATDATITMNDNTVTNPIFGLGMYLEVGVQKTFVKSGSENWAQVLSTTNTDNGQNGYKSIGFYNYAGGKKRVVAPVMAWGVV
tara:strand:- start:538 stop:1191 length:654 start_codon:yes stop_codon:yes gene_type:complete